MHGTNMKIKLAFPICFDTIAPSSGRTNC